MLDAAMLHRIMIDVGLPPHFADQYVRDPAVIAIAEAVFKAGWEVGVKDGLEMELNKDE